MPSVAWKGVLDVWAECEIPKALCCACFSQQKELMVFTRWPVRYQIRIGTLLLLLVVCGLAAGSIQGVQKFRRLTKSIRQRAYELPLAANLGQEVSDLRRINAQAYSQESLASSSYFLQQSKGNLLEPTQESSWLDLRTAFYEQKIQVEQAFTKYQEQLEQEPVSDFRIADISEERAAVSQIRQSLDRINQITNGNVDWYMRTQDTAAVLEPELDDLQAMVSQLPGLLKKRMEEFALAARTEYHAWYAYSFIMLFFAFGTFAVMFYVARKGIFRPLEKLIRGSRRVASGDYDYRINVFVDGEVAELANALNEMTANFQSIKNGLDEQVRQRTKEVLRSEQMASVGFMAAGLAHEINNPLAAIAWSAESLESRFLDLLQDDPTSMDQVDRKKEIDTVLRYLRRIQDEAFRCKGITSGLLDYSRLDNKKKSPTEMVELVQSVIEMVRPLKKYFGRKIHFDPTGTIDGMVNPQEMKQVVLNLITNALESIEKTGNVWVELSSVGGNFLLKVSDDGCGMNAEVKDHLFEPFFTRRVDGSGTGLGLSITYRIIEEHQGQIVAYSQGVNQGSTITVTLPLVKNEQENLKRIAA